MTLHLELSPEETARLASASRHRGVDLETYAKQLLTEHLPPVETESAEIGNFDGKSVYEQFGHLFGGVDGLPADLSTNPAHMRGFGEPKALRNFEH